MTAADDARPHLAQLNVATLRYPLDDPRMAGFTALLDPVNALADGAPGFVWRLVEEGEADATGMRPAGDDVIVNFSVWESSEALWDFVYRSGHLETMRRRREWFQRHVDAHLVLWWIPAGHVPTVAEGLERLELLRTVGPSPRAFTFASSFTAEEALRAGEAGEADAAAGRARGAGRAGRTGESGEAEPAAL
ncbi:DUF3291 domain-containing protein [Actinomadura rubrisoli]|uniref:DUF3291 domain-containing protein n=1 Tax=Actinomadura rubrisoli TaxID=2530368 RepID=A0A4R4ZMQ4_9ACTN|nr:DUF3291 domain-containing protein [Actinomadura rubrisoli]TDD59204.1 DUF3291 domain-containing protein [Actinomadura rubrisoli]